MSADADVRNGSPYDLDKSSKLYKTTMRRGLIRPRRKFQSY
jgi:hypothetical protein